MAKFVVEIEIPDALARRWSDATDVAGKVQEIVAIYGHKPALATSQHKVALGMLRQQMLEQAVKIKGGTDAGPWSVESLADEFIEYLAPKD